MSMKERLQADYPLHWAVFVDDIEAMKSILDSRDDVDINKLDCRGRSPLMLAVAMGNKGCALELLRRGADADSQNKGMWSVSHEAIAQLDPELVQNVIMYRDYQRSAKGAKSIMQNLKRLKDTCDFYCEMKWEFSSWVPFISKLCPSDSYKIYKSGSNIRINTTLIGFEGNMWKRGNQSFIFCIGDDSSPKFIILDHEAKTACVQTIRCDEDLSDFTPSVDSIVERLRNPTTTSYVDIEKIDFERTRTGGLFSWLSSSEKLETIDGYETKVFCASNVSLVTKTRVEHLSTADKERYKASNESGALGSLMNIVRSETVDEHSGGTDALEGGLTALEYLDSSFEMTDDIGKPKQVTRKANTFKATLWLAEDYPLSFAEQLIPVVDLMAANNTHFARLHNFLRMQLPSGFPVKIEIPLFHVVSTRVTFGKINEPGPNVTPLPGETINGVDAVSIDESVFAIPEGYRVVEDSIDMWWPNDEGANVSRYSHHSLGQSAMEQEELLLQYAIQQSLGQSSSNAVDDATLALILQQNDFGVAPQMINVEDELSQALRESQLEEERRARELQQAQIDEDEQLRRVLELSLHDK